MHHTKLPAFVPFTGICLSFNSLSEKLPWFGTHTLECHHSLLSEWQECVTLSNNMKVPSSLAFQLVLFVFNTGLPFSFVGQLFWLKEQRIGGKLAKSTFHKTVKALQVWAKRQIRLPSLSEWHEQSHKVCIILILLISCNVTFSLNLTLHLQDPLQ